MTLVFLKLYYFLFVTTTKLSRHMPHNNNIICVRSYFISSLRRLFNDRGAGAISFVRFEAFCAHVARTSVCQKLGIATPTPPLDRDRGKHEVRPRPQRVRPSWNL